LTNQTIVFPSARALRHELLQEQQENSFLPNYITIGDFLSKLTIVQNRKKIDDDTRTVLLLEASEFKNFASLQIERNFFTFTKNSSYIFKFFEELSSELFDIEKLSDADLYAEYEEHITILQELYKRYELLCEQRGYLDKIFLPKLYEFNFKYLQEHNDIYIHLDGYLTNFEFKLLNEALAFSSIKLEFYATEFNTKMHKRFESLGIEIESGYRYTILLNEKKVLSKRKIQTNINVSVSGFSESLLQVSFVKKAIYDFMQKGYKAENIAIIVPDEKMAQKLRLFDDEHNLNFAMGKPFSQTKLYNKLDATLKELAQDTQENRARLDRVGDTLYEKIASIYYKECSDVVLGDFFEELKLCFSVEEEIAIYDEEVFKLLKLIPHIAGVTVKMLLTILMQRLKSSSLDDVAGGKITVMGVLETRLVHFDAVVIVDFNENNVPKKSDKDMFLNTKIRELATLPTRSDRENLQKHYYSMLINNTKEVAISFVESSQSIASRFLKQLHLSITPIENEADYANIIFTNTPQNIRMEEKIYQEYNFSEVNLSATRLKSFLSCKREYFYRYIKKITAHETPKDMPKEYEIGNLVHQALANIYSKVDSYSCEVTLQKDFERELDILCSKNAFERYLVALQKRKMLPFYKVEIEHFKEGWKVDSVEQSFKIKYKDMTLIGKIDRVDKRDNEILVLDYKTGNYALYNKKNFSEAKDFQLEFYYLLASGLGNVSCAFYDLKECKKVPELFLEEKLELLGAHIKDLHSIEEVDFEMCEDKKQCLFCNYKVLCGRE
jgi:RecB family exonuclease